MESKLRTKLYRGRSGGISIHIDAVIDKENGDLVIEGQDTGSGVSDLFGDSDYEYWLQIPAEHKEPLIKSLMTLGAPEGLAAEENKDKQLLSLVRKHFSVGDVVSKLEDFCEQHGIPTKFFGYH